MVIQVNHTLTKSRNPTEHGLTITGRHGILIHMTGDGYNLIEFFKLTIKKKKTVVNTDGKKKTVYADVKLQWYVHDQDFSIASKQE